MAPFRTNISTDSARLQSPQRQPRLSTLATYLSDLLLQSRFRNREPSGVFAEFLEGTLLFADITGFTALSEELGKNGKEGAEELTTLLNEYFEAMVEIIVAQGGDILQFGGDSLLIAFGATTPGARDQQPFVSPVDDPERSIRRAVQCGLQMQRGMQPFEQLQTSAGLFRLSMSIAVHYGPFLLGSAGAWAGQLQQIVMGPTLNRLAEIERQAEPGEVLVSPEAAERVSAHLLLEPTRGESYRAVVHEYAAEIPWESEFSRDVLQRFDAAHGASAEQLLSPYLIPAVYRRIAEDPAGYAPEGEHRYIATMFVHFAEMREVMQQLGETQAQEIVRYLDAYLVEMTQAIVQHGGALARVSADVQGDKLLVLFGAPVAVEDPELRAVRCALEMRHRLEQLNARSSIALRQKIGIASGSAFCGNVGAERRREYTVIADQVNAAARLMVMAEPSEVLVSRTVWDKTHNAFRYDARGKLPLRGKRNLVEVYQLLGEREYGLPRHRSDRQLVGREAERQTLQEVLERVKQGHGQVLVLSGEAGVGKSRLVRELTAAGRENERTMLHGRCQPDAHCIPYLPWSQIFRQLAGIELTESAEATRRKLRLHLAALGEESTECLPLLEQLLGFPATDNDWTSALSPRQRKEKTFELCTTWLRSAASKRALHLVLEDLQWIDPLSQELLVQVSSRIADLPVLVLIAHRPELNLSEVLASCEQLTVLPLQPLGERSVAELVTQLLDTDSIPEDLLALVQEKTQGNPLYVEEVVRALLDSRHLVWNEQGQTYEMAQDRSTLEVPGSIQSLILARVDRLPEQHRQILQVASVFGSTVPREALTAVLPFPIVPEDLDGCLREIAAHELMVAESSRSQLAMTFAHALVQEAVYGTLSYARRRAIHRAIAEQLERGDQEQLEKNCHVLARHFDLARVAEKALIYLLMAADRARNASANREAASYYERALEYLRGQETGRDPARLAHVLEDAGDVQALNGDYTAAVSCYQEALELADHEVKSARLQGKIGGVAYRQGRPRSGIEHLEMGLAHLGIRAPRTRWQIRRSLARQILIQAGHSLLPWAFPGSRSKDPQATRAAIEIYEALSRISFEFDLEKTLDAHLRQLNLCETLPGSREMAQTYSSHGIVCGAIPLFGRALRYQQRGLAIRQAAGDRWGIAQSYNFMGISYYWMGRWSDALKCLERSAQIFHEVGDRWETEVTYLILSYIDLRLGEFDRAVQHAQTTLRLSEMADDRQGMGWALGALAEAQSRQGKLDEALASGRRALACSEQAHDRMYVAVIHRVLGEILLRQGQLKPARDQMQKAVEQIEQYRLRHEFVLGAYAGLVETSIHEMLLDDRPLSERRASLRRLDKSCRHAVRQARRYPNWQGSAFRVCGLHAWAAQQPKAARRWFEKSISACRAQGARYELAQAQYDYGCFLLETDRAAAQRCFIEARDLFTRCGAALDERRAELLLRQTLQAGEHVDRGLKGPHRALITTKNGYRRTNNDE